MVRSDRLLVYDPLTPLLTQATNLRSPFRIGLAHATVQGVELPSAPYAMGSRLTASSTYSAILRFVSNSLTPLPSPSTVKARYPLGPCCGTKCTVYLRQIAGTGFLHQAPQRT